MHAPRYDDVVAYQVITFDGNSHDTNNNNNISNTGTALGKYDVICGRHKAAFDNIGNRRFRILVALAHEKYANAPTRAHKSIVIKNIIDSVHNGGGRFLQQIGCSNWEELDEKQTHDKVGHALRDMAVASKAKSTSYKSRKVSIDLSIRSNTSKSSTSVSEGHKIEKSTCQEYCNSKENNRCVSNGYNVPIAHVAQHENTFHFDPNDNYVNETDDSLEPIAWQEATGKQASCDVNSKRSTVDSCFFSTLLCDDSAFTTRF